MVSTVLAAIRFLSRHGWAAARLYSLNLALIVLVMALYALVAPGAGAVGWTMWAGFAVGQLYLVARVWAKLVTWASETALFQSRLAHAGHVRRSAPPWPDSPAAEALKRGGEAFSL